MLRATCVVVIAVLAGCLDTPPEPAPVSDAGEPPPDVMQPPAPVPAPSTCSVDSLAGCRAAGASCTWCAPIGAACTREYVDLCGGGHGWCSEARVCRQVCSPVDVPRCPAGTVVSHEADPERGADVCYCAPE